MSTYSGLLLDRYRSPEFRGKPESFVAHAEAVNRTCGDHIHVYLSNSQKLHWDGKGCMLCMVSAELLCYVHNQEYSVSDLHEILTTERANTLDIDEITALKEALASYPTRQKCLLLAWDAFRSLPLR